MRKSTLLLMMFFITSMLSAQFPNEDFYVDDDDYYSNRIANDDDYLWIVSHQGLIHYEKSTGVCVKSNALFSLPDTTIFLSVYKDRKNHLWVCGRHKEVMRYDGREITYYATDYRRDPAYPLLRHCYTMAFDEDNNPYLGASYKVFHQFAFSEEDEKYYPGKSFSTLGSSLPLAMDLAWNSSGELVLLAARVGYKKVDLICFANRISKWYDLQDCYASSIIVDRSDKLWVSSNKGLYCIDNETRLVQLYTHRTHPEVPEGWYVASDIDAEGNLWFSATDFLLRYDGQTFTRYSCDGYNEARSILCDGNRVWIYTNDDAILRFENGEFSRVAISDTPTGMQPVSVSGSYRVSCNEQGILTVSGDAGIGRVKVYTTLGVEVAHATGQGESSLTLPQISLENDLVYIVQIQNWENGTSSICKVKK